MIDRNAPIAVFDSGVGGISVLRMLRRLLPEEHFLYYGDTANAPYGTRSTAEVLQLTMAAAEKLLAHNAKALVIACNTATAAAIRTLRETYPDTIIIGIEPALKLAADHYPQARVGVLATPLTLREEKFSHLQDRFPEMSVTAIPLPGLVEQIEQGSTDDRLEQFLRPTLAPYTGKLDAVVLGCTHYPFAARAIRRILGADTAILDGAEGTARETQRRLQAADLLARREGALEFLCSGNSQDFTERCLTLLAQQPTE